MQIGDRKATPPRRLRSHRNGERSSLGEVALQLCVQAGARLAQEQALVAIGDLKQRAYLLCAPAFDVSQEDHLQPERGEPHDGFARELKYLRALDAILRRGLRGLPPLTGLRHTLAEEAIWFHCIVLAVFGESHEGNR